MLDRLRPSPALITRLSLTALVANTVIVISGATVRLTGSGLGCPTWPRCSDASFVATSEYGIHGVIEFANRLLGFVLAGAVAACVAATLRQRPRRRDLVLLSWALFGGVLAQGVLGGITVLTHLNPWTVAGHFLVSMALLAAGVALYVRSKEPDGPVRPVVPEAMRWLARLLVALTAVVLVLGTVVTGSGPHAGDVSAARTGFDPATVSQLHAHAVMLLIGVTVATVVGLRVTGAPRRARRAAAVLVAAEVTQGAIGYLQYFTGLPVALVAAHVLGACVVWLAALWLMFTLRERRPAAPDGARLTATSAAAPAR